METTGKRQWDCGHGRTIERGDWECAPDPICMAPVTDGEMDTVAERLRASVEEWTEAGVDGDRLDELFWREYERLVTALTDAFHYGDLTDAQLMELEASGLSPETAARIGRETRQADRQTT